MVIEVGANFGGSTLLLASLASYVYAFEPVPLTFRYLRAFTARKKNVEACNLGASNERAIVSMQVGKNPEVSSRFRIRNQQYERSVPATLVRLDSLRYARKPSCIVMDCEGSEVDALKGATGLFDTGLIHCLLIETHYFSDGSSTLESVISLVEDYGFDFEIETDSHGMPWILAQVTGHDQASQHAKRVDFTVSDSRFPY